MQRSHQNDPFEADWFLDGHAQGWTRLRDAIRRDWDQTMADLTTHRGHELYQTVGDTVRQVMGTEPVPPPGIPNPFLVHFDRVASDPFGRSDPEFWDSEMEEAAEQDWYALGALQPLRFAPI